ncbi:uncharacterized protein LOC111327462 [Stylophora pistillata]|uniref:uncharacterized protein LOC111327462 n=1 Tax=Stylophora pistillata TaxID=50429 RepID=UPI000C03EBEF|nr:uncharacterized protein LOC111327462 [Stylophora pistillata]
MRQVCLPIVGMGNSDWSVLKLSEHFCKINDLFKTCRISNTLDSMEDEAIYSEETVEPADEEEMDDEFDADTEDKQDKRDCLKMSPGKGLKWYLSLCNSAGTGRAFCKFRFNKCFVLDCDCLSGGRHLLKMLEMAFA